MLIERVAELMREAAAAIVLPRFGQLTPNQIETKQPGGKVTIADREAEAWLGPRLAALLPASRLVGEEAAEFDDGTLLALDADGASWVIDPIDGTGNFVDASPNFAIMVALVRDRATVAGWILDPLTDTLVTAESGGGAWLDGRRLDLSHAAPVLDAQAVWFVGNGKLRTALVKSGTLLAHCDTLGCAGHEYLRLVRGGAEIGYYRRLKPWDHAPGTLIHREAGGYGALFDGGPYRPILDPGPLLLAPDEAGWHRAREVIARLSS